MGYSEEATRKFGRFLTDDNDSISNMAPAAGIEIYSGKTHAGGKPVYRQRFTGTLDGTSSDSLGDIDADEIIALGGTILDTSAGFSYTPGALSTDYWYLRLTPATGDLALLYGSVYDNTDTFDIWVEYTKIGD